MQLCPVAPVTGPPSRVSGQKDLCSLGSRKAHKSLTHALPVRRPPGHRSGHRPKRIMFMCLFPSWWSETGREKNITILEPLEASYPFLAPHPSYRSRFWGRGSDEALFSEERVFQWKGGRHSVNEPRFGKDLHKNGNSLAATKHLVQLGVLQPRPLGYSWNLCNLGLCKGI